MIQLETMRTRFAGRGHAPVTPVSFAAGTLRSRKATILSQLRAVGFVPKGELDILDVELGDPAEPVKDAPVAAFVNAGRWIAVCDFCGGAEYVDPETPLLMCCSCFNVAFDRQWRTVALPAEATKADIESLLLARPEEATRNWQSDEPLELLVIENVLNGVPVDEAILARVQPPVIVAPRVVDPPAPEEVLDGLD